MKVSYSLSRKSFSYPLAHNCTKKSPGSEFMQDFYWPKKISKEPVPHILGLTASPVMGSNLGDLKILESILDATCKRPHKQKIDLSLHVKPLIMMQISFYGNGSILNNPHDSGNIASLIAVYLNLNVHNDPVIIRLRTTNTEASERKLEQVLMRKKIFIQNRMGSFIRTSGEINSGLGNWAADTCVSQVTSSFIQSTDLKDTRSLE